MNPPTTEQAVSQLTQLIAAVAGVELTQATSPAAQRSLLDANWESIEQAAAQLLAAWAEHHPATVLNVSSLALAYCHAHQRARRQANHTAIPCVIECA